MLKSFYKYVVKDLLLDFFKKNPINKGSRYYFIIENEEHRNGFMEALNELAEKIKISNVYQGTSSQEDSYDTVVLSPIDGGVKIIVGYEKTSTEDYLTTLRNAVGFPGSEYEDYGLLFILSDSVLSSIITTCQDLQAVGYPFNPYYIFDVINKKAQTVLPKDCECNYLEQHLRKVAENIEDGIYNLFDFKYALSVLEDKSLKKHYTELEYFQDTKIDDPSFVPTKNEMVKRAKDNQDTYLLVSCIMNENDDEDKEKLLLKTFDERLTKKLIAAKELWINTDYQEFIDSKSRKVKTANLELLGIDLKNEDAFTSLVKNSDSKSGKEAKSNKKKSANYLIICDEGTDSPKQIKLTFNKDIPKNNKIDNCKVSGRFVTLSVDKSLVKQCIGINDNHHDFFAIKIPCNKSFFDHVKNDFIIDSKGRIVITVPEDKESVLFGNGSLEMSLPITGSLLWSPEYSLRIPVNEDSDEEKKEFSIFFGKTEIKFVLKFFEGKPKLPLTPSTIDPEIVYHGVEFEGSPFGKITDGENEYAVVKFWKPYLELEYSFIESKCQYVRFSKNSFSQKIESDCVSCEIPTSVSVTLNSIFDYYRNNNTIPSLCPLNDELRDLYKKYHAAVVETVNQLSSSNSTLPNAIFNMTKLGTVERGENVFFSPFHPILVAYLLEKDKQFEKIDGSSIINKLSSAENLIPYITYNDIPRQPSCFGDFSKLSNWLCYETVTDRPQESTNDITTRTVCSRLMDFKNHFNYLFQDKECPLVMNTVGIYDDTNVIKGVVEFIKKEMNSDVQKIEIHEYVENLYNECYFEKLNRIGSVDGVLRELERIGVQTELKGSFSGQDLIRQLFTRISFFKHSLKDCDNHISYCHIAFYQMSSGTSFVEPNTNDSRVELALNGLISSPSTSCKDRAYTIGFGCRGIIADEGYICPMAIAMNNLYANEKNEGCSVYRDHTCVAKRYKFCSSELLESIYENANWVTFINPEVDIDFFYNQDLYIIHYADPCSINAKYDSITITKHIDQYENMLRNVYLKYSASADCFETFNRTMRNFFNCLNGNWMLNIVNKTDLQIREKMSLVAACVAMMHFMKRAGDIIWIPISLEEILRVTGSIGLPLDSIFSKKRLDVHGVMSDDLLMIGLDASDDKNIKLYYYPVEVKYSKNGDFVKKGEEQVVQTFLQIQKHIFGTENFVKKIYKTFFASQFLTNAEKFNANNVISNETYAKIDKCRYKLLNLKYTLEEKMPVKELGDAALVSFCNAASHEIRTSLTESVAICELNFSEDECFKFVADYDKGSDQYLIDSPIIYEVDESAVASSNPNDADADLTEIEVVPIEDDKPEVDDSPIIVPPISAHIPVEQQGIKIIIGSVNNRKIIFEPNNTKVVSHPNMAIIGTMGTGKTQLARSIIAQFSKESLHNVDQKNIGMLVFDYKGDYKDDEFLKAVNGKAYRHNYPFNPLKLIVRDEVIGFNLPAITADQISDSFAKAYGLGLKQKSNIKQVIIDTYGAVGITKDPSTWSKVAPTMSDVINNYFENFDTNDKAYALFDKLRDYPIFTSDQTECVSLFEWLDGVKVIDLTIYPDDTKKVIVSLILDLFYAEMMQLGGSKQNEGFRELRSMIMVDEAHQFLKKDFASLRKIMSEGRMFGVGMILSTQNLSDFKTSKEDYSAFILSWMIHHVNSLSKSDMSCIFGSDPNIEKYMEYINKAQIFKSVSKIGSRIEGVEDLPFFKLIKEDDRFISQG